MSSWAVSLRAGWYWIGDLHARWRLYYVVDQTGLHIAQLRTKQHTNTTSLCILVVYKPNQIHKYISLRVLKFLSLRRPDSLAPCAPMSVISRALMHTLSMSSSSSVRRSISCARTLGCRRSRTVATPTRGRSVSQSNPNAHWPHFIFMLRLHWSTGSHHGQIRDPLFHCVRHPGAHLNVNANADSDLTGPNLNMKTKQHSTSAFTVPLALTSLLSPNAKDQCHLFMHMHGCAGAIPQNHREKWLPSTAVGSLHHQTWQIWIAHDLIESD